MSKGPDCEEIARLLELQDGVIARHQARLCGARPHDIRRLLRQRQWVVLHDGVYVSHTGRPTWQQRAWAAVLYAGRGAALDRESALRADGGPGWRGRPDEAPIQVAIDARRTVKSLDDVRIRRVAKLADKVRWMAAPPRLRVEEAALDLALSRTGDHEVFEALAAPVRARSTTAQRLLDALADRPKVARREWLGELLADLRDGSCSALERGYLVRVERAHGLPAPVRQRHERPSGRSLYRDVDYDDFGVVVELDGRVHERNEQRDSDLDRDLDAAAQEKVTVRLGWRQVFRSPCRTAVRVAAVLTSRGWQGRPTTCGPACEIDDASAA